MRVVELLSAMKHLFCLLLALQLALPAVAREWYRPVHQGKSFVNCDLTPTRLTHPKPEWNGQLVLWEGTIQKLQQEGSKTQLTLLTETGPVEVTYPTQALTLDQDRTGYRVAVKGNLELTDGQMTGLVGRSAILLGPPKPWTTPRPAADPVVSFLAWWAGFHNPQYPSARLNEIAQALADESRTNGLDPLFLASLVQIESAFRPDAVSCSGAIGLGQLMPFVASGMGLDPHDIKQNVAGSAKMLANLLKAWETSDNPKAMALASYNAGPNLVRQLGGVPRVPQTTNYVYFIGYVYERMKTVAQAQGLAL